MNHGSSTQTTGRRAFRFALSGLLVTALHTVIAIFFMENVVSIPSLANGVAFVVANAVSYVLHTTWSFSSPLHGKSLLRFCLVSLAGLLLAMGISAGVQMFEINYLYGIGLTICILPPLTFFLHNFWTYR